MGELSPENEYLVWYDQRRRRWIAMPISRVGGVIIESEYAAPIEVLIGGPGEDAG